MGCCCCKTEDDTPETAEHKYYGNTLLIVEEGDVFEKPAYVDLVVVKNQTLSRYAPIVVEKRQY